MLAPFRPARVAAVIAEIAPDLLALQEAQHHFRRGRDMLDAAALAGDCGLHLLRPVAGQQGYRSNLVFARAEAVVRLGPVGLPLGGWEPRGAVLAELDFGRGPFRLLAAHLSLTARRRAAQAEILLAAARAAAGMPALLLGDLNEWREGGSALEVLAAGFGSPPPVPTFPARWPMLALDRILSDPPGRVSGVRAHDTALSRRASDHLPLVARFDDAAR